MQTSEGNCFKMSESRAVQIMLTKLFVSAPSILARQQVSLFAGIASFGMTVLLYHKYLRKSVNRKQKMNGQD